MSPPAKSAHWVNLNDALLEQIFQIVCTTSKSGSDVRPENTIPPIPLVCRRFNSVYKSSPILWKRVKLDWRVAFSDLASGVQSLLQFGYISRWLQARAPLIRNLTLVNCQPLGPALDILLSSFCCNAPQLVSITLTGLKGNADHHVAALCAATSLRSIKISWDQPAEGHTAPLRISSTALQGFSALKNLENIDLEVDSINGTTADFQVWSLLNKLTSLRLAGRMESIILHPDMLAALSTLRRLDLSLVRLPQFSPGMVHALGAVTHLSLNNVLAAKPRRKSGFTLWHALCGLRSLRHLSISGAGKDAGLPCNALACPGLQSLTLHECPMLSKWPSIADVAAGRYCAALESLEKLVLNDVGLPETPSSVLWGRFKKLNALTWRAVHHAAPRHRYWDHGGPYEITDAMEPVLRMLRVLRLEFPGMNEEQLERVASVLHAASRLQELSLEGSRLGGTHGVEVLNALIHDKLNLKRLSLANCGLQSLPPAIFVLSSLDDLNLADNPGLQTGGEEDKMLAKVKTVKRNDRQAALAAVLPRMGSLSNEVPRAAGI